jgi:dihydropteroate synthase
MMKTVSKFPDLSSPVVMGILNITPDSFYDGGRFQGEESWLIQSEKMITEGAAIIDIGGASSRPGAQALSPEEEWNRLSPVLEIIRKKYQDICISIDTYHSQVAAWAIRAGADMINDISGGIFDGEKMAKVIGNENTPYVMMHMQGMPNNMQITPAYEDVVEEIRHFFEEQIQLFKQAGADNLILDPGFGFGKDVKHNYELLGNLKAFNDLGYPVMAGISRKSMINKVLNISAKEALNGTSILNTIALMNGAKILRVHDVKEAVEAVKLVGQMLDTSNQ